MLSLDSKGVSTKASCQMAHLAEINNILPINIIQIEIIFIKVILSSRMIADNNKTTITYELLAITNVPEFGLFLIAKKNNILPIIAEVADIKRYTIDLLSNANPLFFIPKTNNKRMLNIPIINP